MKEQILQQYNETQTPGVPNRWGKARQMLEDWVVDPSFGRSAARFQMEVANEQEVRSDDEIVSKSRLEVLEGKDGAKELLENNSLPVTKDRYGC